MQLKERGVAESQKETQSNRTDVTDSSCLLFNQENNRMKVVSNSEENSSVTVEHSFRNSALSVYLMMPWSVILRE